ncbi:Beta-hexosaminidase subunit beta [Amphibalanus amphitrite]|uniref:beta-N-acetylhexosaminidase n=1 Tax=Amphibalanus amphitrite TaxID=1232801 RepID=A0A6A4WS24_AMPAM|nr:Beta-hexosaminidase subunit beta [Amphibalanus amphitrite]
MASTVSSLQLALIAAVCSCHLVPTEAGFPWVEPTEGEPWPAPQQADMYPSFYFVNPAKIRFRTTRHSCADLEDAIGRTLQTLRDLAASHGVRAGRRPRSVVSGSLRERRTRVAASANRRRSRKRGESRRASSPRLHHDVEVWMDGMCDEKMMPSATMDEQYSIKINVPDSPGRAQIISDSLWGAYRGLETFTQLIYFSEKHGQFHLRQGIIRDFPRYAHRGLMLDTSRHFLSVSSIKATLELMAFNKFNVFHWHLVDDPSFPFVSVTFPNLSGKGAYRPDMVYTLDDVADIIEFARRRGIRVVPEVDTPGHVRSWGAGADNLLTVCYNETTGQPDGTFGPLDPTKGSTYRFVRRLLEEVTTRFPDKYIHLGGDEVFFGFPCWLSNPDVQAWMEKLNISTAEEVEKAYMQRLLRLVKRLPAKPEYVIWQDVVDNNITVQPDTIVHVWKGGADGWQQEADKVTSLGHRTIISSCWYLNYINYGVDWPQYYECEPEDFNGTLVQKSLLLGGEACMWGEFVDDTNLISRTWPRAAAVAERLWSAKEVSDAEVARPRMEEHRPRGRCLKRGGKQWKAANRSKGLSKPPTGDGRRVHASVTGRLSGSSSSPRGRPRCPKGYKRHRSGRCVRLGARTASGRGLKPGALRGRAEQCTGGRVAWADGRCVPLATLRSCPKDSYRLSSGLCVRCWVSDKTDESCAKGCAVDERRAKCICCMPNGDDP